MQYAKICQVFNNYWHQKNTSFFFFFFREFLLQVFYFFFCFLYFQFLCIVIFYSCRYIVYVGRLFSSQWTFRKMLINAQFFKHNQIRITNANIWNILITFIHFGGTVLYFMYFGGSHATATILSFYVLNTISYLVLKEKHSSTVVPYLVISFFGSCKKTFCRVTFKACKFCTLA